MEQYKAIIIDDEALAIDVVEHYLQRFPEFEIVRTFTDATEAFQYLNKNVVDIVFTDIGMPEISGIELVRLSQNSTSFVMITSFSEFALESFELNVVDYLLKPVSFERFAKTIERFKSNKLNTEEKTAPSFYIKEGDEFVKVLVEDIDYIEGMKDYAKIVCGNNYYMALKTLKSLEKKLNPYGFIRCHKSFIVPTKKIDQYNHRGIIINAHEIPVGNSYKQSFKRALEKMSL